jgi:uncharacterized protein (TIRG00374 family)
MKRALQLAVSLAISLVFVWLSLKGTDLGEVGRTMLAVDPGYLGLHILSLVAIHLFRVQRWKLLLEPLAPAPFREVNALSAVGFMAIVVLPLRLGEFARPVLASKRLGVRGSAALASVVVERIIDGLSMGLMLVVLLWTLSDDLAGGAHMAELRTGGLFVTLAFASGLAALVLAVKQRQLAERLVTRFLGALSPRLATRVSGMLAAFTDGLEVLPSAGRVAQFLAYTALYWGVNAAGLWALGVGFGFHLTAEQTLTVLGIQVIGAMIPAGPGMVGTLQWFTELGLKLFLGAGAATVSAAFAHTIWLMAFGQQVLFGLYFVLVGRVRPAEIFRRDALNPAASAPNPA